MLKRILIPFIAVGFIVGCLVASCGVKAPPLPPEFVVPKKIDDLKVKKEDGGVLLKWTKPKENTDDSTLDDLLGFRVFRKDIPDEDIDCPPCSGEFEEIYDFTLVAPGRANIKGDTIYLEDLSLSSGITYIYMVVSRNSGGFYSDPSNTIEVYFQR